MARARALRGAKGREVGVRSTGDGMAAGGPYPMRAALARNAAVASGASGLRQQWISGAV